MADGVERTLEQSLGQAERLRQSILKKAFEGRLVAQDAEDEPANVLLSRIKQERADWRKAKNSASKTANMYELKTLGKFYQKPLRKVYQTTGMAHHTRTRPPEA